MAPYRCLFLDAAEAGQFLRFHPKTVMLLARQGKLPGYPIGDGPRKHGCFSVLSWTFGCAPRYIPEATRARERKEKNAASTLSRRVPVPASQEIRGRLGVQVPRNLTRGKTDTTHVCVGPVSRLKTERDARRAIELVRVNINADGRAVGPTMLFSVLADHYSKYEMPMDDHSRKAFSTKDTNRGYLRKWIVPKWGDRLVCDIRTIEVENWLNGLEKLSDGSRAKIRNLMSAIYRHAMRHEFVEKNPIKLVRQSSKRKRVPEVLTVSELAALLKGLRLRERVMVLLDAGSGLAPRRAVRPDLGGCGL